MPFEKQTILLNTYLLPQGSTKIGAMWGTLCSGRNGFILDFSHAFIYNSEKQLFRREK